MFDSKKRTIQEKEELHPDPRVAAIEKESGVSFAGVNIHYTSSKPKEFNAHAYAYGNDVFLGPGQEKHLRHELGHVIQQRQHRVNTESYHKGIPVNQKNSLEEEANILLNSPIKNTPIITENNRLVGGVVQLAKCTVKENDEDHELYIAEYTLDRNDVNLPYQEGFSHNHSTAFDVFVNLLSNRLQYHLVENCPHIFKALFAEMSQLPGSNRCMGWIMVMLDECDTLGNDIRSAMEESNINAIEEALLDMGAAYLAVRNEVGYSYLPGDFPAVGHNEAGQMGALRASLSMQSAPGIPLTKINPCFLSAVSCIVTLFDTISYRPINNAYIAQHVMTIRNAFTGVEGINEELLEAALTEAESQIQAKVNTPFSQNEIAYRDKIRGNKMLSSLMGRKNQKELPSYFQDMTAKEKGDFLDKVYVKIRDKKDDTPFNPASFF